jgi:hypothetical protein
MGFQDPLIARMRSETPIPGPMRLLDRGMVNQHFYFVVLILLADILVRQQFRTGEERRGEEGRGKERRGRRIVTQAP